MSWRLGRSNKASATNLRADAGVAGRTTPTPDNIDPEGPDVRTGLLAIRVLWAEGLALPSGTPMPAAVQAALSSQQAKVAASISPASVTQSRLAKKGARDRYVV